MNFDWGFSFSQDIHGLVQAASIRLRNAGFSTFMYDAEPQEAGVLWDNIQSRYAACTGIIIFINERYLARPVTRREYQHFAEFCDRRWSRQSIHAFVDHSVKDSSILFPPFFVRHTMEDVGDIHTLLK